jgi:signal transduction histidine kinase
MTTDWIKRFQALPPIVTDAALALLLMISADAAAYQDAGGLTALQVVMIALITLPVATRRRFPATVTAFIGSALILNLLLGFTNSFIENFAVLVALYTLYASVGAEWRLAVVSGLLVVGLVAGVALGWRNQHQVYLSDIGYNSIIFALPVILGSGVHTRRAYIAHLHEQSRLLAREAAANERTAIARELHDVIAHSVSVMVLQAAAGGRLAAMILPAQRRHSRSSSMPAVTRSPICVAWLGCSRTTPPRRWSCRLSPACSSWKRWSSRCGRRA